MSNYTSRRWENGMNIGDSYSRYVGLIANSDEEYESLIKSMEI